MEPTLEELVFYHDVETKASSTGAFNVAHRLPQVGDLRHAPAPYFFSAVKVPAPNWPYSTVPFMVAPSRVPL
jgi:hypothetical protein